MNLYEIRTEYKALLEDICDPETGEIDDTALTKLSELETTMQDKCIAVASYIENLDAERKAIEEAKKNMAAREQRVKKRIEQLKHYMQENMEASEIKKISCPYFDIALHKNPPAVEILNEEEIPLEYKKLEVTIDKAKLRAALLGNIQVEGAKLIQKNSLRIK